MISLLILLFVVVVGYLIAVALTGSQVIALIVVLIVLLAGVPGGAYGRWR